MKTVLLAAVAALAGLLLFLLASASANTSLFARNYPVLLAANGVLVVSLGERGVDDREALSQGRALLLQSPLDGVGAGVGKSLVEVG